ncbi:MAG TPA: MFS transporter [Planctomycetaceae bacterium]|jgi:MFS family permease
MSTIPPFATTSPALDSRPTRIRHVVIFVAVLMSIILYLDRLCVSISSGYIREDLALTEGQMGLFFSAFFWTYALAQVPAGRLGDLLGSRGVLVLYIVTWSFFTAMMGLATGFIMLMAMRLGCGLAQAGAYPTAGSLLSRWVPFSSRGFASALVALGGRTGAVIAPILTAYLMVLFVPMSTPAELDATAILDGPALCARLLPAADIDPDGVNRKGDKSAAEHRLNQFLSDDAQWVVIQYGTLVHMAKSIPRIEFEGPPNDKKPILKPGLPPALGKVRIDAHDLDVLVAGLNGLLKNPGAFKNDDLGRLGLEREAQQLLKRRQDGETLTAQETLRFNRLVLEAMFPKEIGKLYVKGWRPVLIVYGFAGLVVAVFYWICFRNSPAEHPRCNAAERALIAGGEAEKAASAKSSADVFPGRAILRSTSLWLSSLSQFGTNFGWVFLVTKLPDYLKDVHDVPIIERGLMVSIPALAGIAGMFLGGLLTDVLTRHLGVRWGRGLPMALTRFGAAAAYFSCLWIDSPWPATIAFSFVFFFVDLGTSAVWAFMQDAGGKHVGAILGWGNMWGNFGAAVANPVFAAILVNKSFSNPWHTVFITCAVTFVLTGIAGLWIDASKPIADH